MKTKASDKSKEKGKINPIHKMPFGEIIERIVKVKPEKKAKTKKSK